MYRLLALVLFPLLGCVAPQTSEGLSESDEAAVRSLVQGLASAAETEEYQSLGRFFTEDAVWMPQDQAAVEGRPAIQAWFTVGANAWDHRVLEVNGSGDFAYVRATFTLDLKIEGFTPYSGKSLTVLRKQSDGSWLISHSAQSCSNTCG